MKILTTLLLLIAFNANANGCNCMPFRVENMFNYQTIALVYRLDYNGDELYHLHIERLYKGKFKVANNKFQNIVTYRTEDNDLWKHHAKIEKGKYYIIAINEDSTTKDNIINLNICGGVYNFRNQNLDSILLDTTLIQLEKQILKTNKHFLPQIPYLGFETDKQNLNKRTDVEEIHRISLPTDSAQLAIANIMKNINFVGLDEKDLDYVFSHYKLSTIYPNSKTFILDFGLWSTIYQFALRDGVVVSVLQIPGE